ncbi:MAG: hypothetical protein HYS62_03460 [Candidatus Aenigmarchaeota archaeon]|nr:hypothetical protein [Candidatus Aenigmarchaeota archaeon]
MGIEHKITGILHLVAVLIIVLFSLTDEIPKSFAFLSVLFFVVKGIGFAIMKQNPLSALDAIAGIYLLFAVLGWFSNGVLNWIVIIFLAQKGVVYLFR